MKKKCNTCTTVKDVSCFYKQVKGKYGKGTICKNCLKLKHKKTYTSIKPVYPKDKKKCATCNKLLNLKEFSTRGKQSTYTSSCKICLNDTGKPSRYKKYGITVEDYNNMFKEQNGLCAICNIVSNRSLCVDHNHNTGKARKLLCNNCNSAIGKFRENIDIMAAAIDYIKYFSK